MLWEEYGVWTCSDGGTICTWLDSEQRALSCSGSKLVYTFMAPDWGTAMQKYYDYMNWGTYKP
jgi:hypothetical protein